MEVMTVSSSEMSDDGEGRGSGRSTSTYPQEQSCMRGHDDVGEEVDVDGDQSPNRFKPVSMGVLPSTKM